MTSDKDRTQPVKDGEVPAARIPVETWSQETLIFISKVLGEVRRIEEQTGRRPLRAFVSCLDLPELASVKTAFGVDTLTFGDVEIRMLSFMKRGEIALTVAHHER